MQAQAETTKVSIGKCLDKHRKNTVVNDSLKCKNRGGRYERAVKVHTMTTSEILMMKTKSEQP